MNRRSHYDIVKVLPDKVYLVDRDGAISVTNDAERVCAEVNAEHPGVRIIYCDTDGNWDELLHVAGAFQAFAPARGDRP